MKVTDCQVLAAPHFQQEVNCGSEVSPQAGHTQEFPVAGGAACHIFLIFKASASC
jgi:hypothetical protein